MNMQKSALFFIWADNSPGPLDQSSIGFWNFVQGRDPNLGVQAHQTMQFPLEILSGMLISSQKSEAKSRFSSL